MDERRSKKKGRKEEKKKKKKEKKEGYMYIQSTRRVSQVCSESVNVLGLAACRSSSSISSGLPISETALQSHLSQPENQICDINSRPNTVIQNQSTVETFQTALHWPPNPNDTDTGIQVCFSQTDIHSNCQPAVYLGFSLINVRV